MSTETNGPDLAPKLERCFLFEATEDSYDVTGITGRVPDWLRGSYYVNGPARFERAGMRYKHWLDGDGMVCSLRFSANGIRFTNRFVQTRKLLEENQAGRFLYRGFGTAFPGDRLRRKVMLEPPVNVSVYRYDGRLLAFGEQSLPVELDPLTLETRGEYDFHGRLNEVSPFSAHAKYDGRLLNFGVSFSASQPMLNTFEFNARGELLQRRRYPLEFAHSVHDFGFTPERMVFYLSPLFMDFGHFWSEGVSVMESLRWQPEHGSRIMVVPRAGCSHEPFSIKTTAAYCLHLINCFERGGRLNVDILELEKPVYPDYQPIPDLFAEVAPCRPVRYVIDLESRAVVERIAMPYDRTPDFPNVDPARAGRCSADFWILGISASGQPGRKFFDQLARGSWDAGDVTDVFQSPAGEYLGGEPVYIANPSDPDEAVVIVEHLQPASDSASFLLFDANALSSGPIARLPLRGRVHPGFHASWSAE